MASLAYCLSAFIFLHLQLYSCAIDHGDIAARQDEHFSLVHLPGPNSPLVLKEMADLQLVIDIQKLADNFCHLGSLGGVAYYAAVGYADHDLQEKTKNVYQDIETLHGKFSTTFDSFMSTSEDVLGELQAAFMHLAQGNQQKAVSIIRMVSQATERLANAADALHHEATTNEQKVARLLESTINTKSRHEDRKQEFEKKRQELLSEQVRIQKQKQNAATAAETAKKHADKAKHDAEEEKRKLKKKKKGWGIVYDVLDDWFNIELLKKHEEREKAARKEQYSHDATVIKQQELYHQAEQQLSSLGSQLQKLQEDVNLMNDAVGSLHGAVGEFLSLSVIMIDATTFWKGMQGHSENLVEMLTLTEKDFSANTRQQVKVWESLPFQSKAIQLHTKWLALKLQSTFYLENTKEVQAQMASYISVKQPTVAEARKIVKHLMDEFVKEARKNVKDEL